ncbi:MAG: hypothetical protein JOZ98_15400 [Solirubrobacterales bacterium]|nr:hypothetical protein [Solirubrobacterales bacterium]
MLPLLSELAEVLPLEVPLDDVWEACVLVPVPDAVLLGVLVCPGKAFAARNANAPVSATEPAISQRLVRETRAMARLREVVFRFRSVIVLASVEPDDKKPVRRV